MFVLSICCHRAEYEFTPSSPDGAILILPHGATFHDLRPKSQFRDLAIQRAFEWYRFATQHLQRQICNHSLYLITGFYKARSWSLASFQNAAPAAGGNSALIRVVKVGEGSSYGWESTFHMEWNDGPRGGRNGNVNQSVFLRGFKIAVRDDIFGLWTQPVVEVVPRPKSPGVVKCSCLSFLKWPFRKQRTPSPYTPRPAKNSSPNPAHVPQLSQVNTSPATFNTATD